jgi:hypothetical protein
MPSLKCITPETSPSSGDGSEPLGGRREQFAQLIAGGLSQVAAYASAGYSADASNAAKLAREEAVAQRVAWLQEQASATISEVLSQQLSTVIATRAWVLDKLVQNALQSMGEKPFLRRVVTNGRVQEQPVFYYSPAAANRALELVGQEIGMFKGDGGAERDSDLDAARNAADPRIVAMLERYRRMYAAPIGEAPE